MAAKILEIRIPRKGQTTIEAMGFQGEACRSASDALSKAIGRITADEDKDDREPPPDIASTQSLAAGG